MGEEYLGELAVTAHMQIDFTVSNKAPNNQVGKSPANAGSTVCGRIISSEIISRRPGKPCVTAKTDQDQRYCNGLGESSTAAPKRIFPPNFCPIVLAWIS
jgi:hypothetical protein